ncbi:MAG: type II toxin-antitoxin system VapC family toxin [Bacteroidales bacterium]|nr:type II toxin-antitoxin system VapC family toxin [Bacteroidales bacterium]
METQRYLLDTCILVNLFRGKPDTQQRIQTIGWKKCFTASACLCELYAGAFKSGRTRDFRLIEWLTTKMIILPFDNAAITYGKIRARLEQQGNKLDDMDMLIASIAIDNNLTLVTGNTRHFSRIPGLKLEVWE